MLTVCDILSAASLEFPGCNIDFYWILQLKPSANETDLRTRSQKLVSLMQPIKKSFPGTELALQLVKSAEVFDCVVSGQSSSGNKRVCMSELSDGSNGHDVVKKVRLSGDEIKEGGVEVDRIENSTSSQIVNDTMDVKCTKDVSEEKTSCAFYDFENDRKQDVFEVGQIWAGHHQSRLPLRYGRINSKTG
ncbi:hypothetical protein IFM89_016869 [Coptis chinensis]|uniref:DUF3444 domain-containing protein n=1 Tax=Coptis chinensis TaxID=261450 RepID=A0A835I5F1_9MAGN|nr:hypothetical protein IFM89_016869 [Coptis chinensis]